VPMVEARFLGLELGDLVCGWESRKGRRVLIGDWEVAFMMCLEASWFGSREAVAVRVWM
jgi:hypothetical protein